MNKSRQSTPLLFCMGNIYVAIAVENVQKKIWWIRRIMLYFMTTLICVRKNHVCVTMPKLFFHKFNQYRYNIKKYFNFVSKLQDLMCCIYTCKNIFLKVRTMISKQSRKMMGQNMLSEKMMIMKKKKIKIKLNAYSI